uniref:N-methylcoclaurine 3'-monooxygenase n=1 Tax=Eschscholzia californica subsp. californica TaxID=222997 RepID=A0A2Z6BXS3_ESCCA|nr:putative cytochrome P450 [Eschscholzia californica subsp. californica]
MEVVTVALVAVLISSILYLIFGGTHHKNLPPGPKPWPIVGNLLQLSDRPHSQFAELAKIYGDLFTLRLGSETVVVASTPAAAAEIIKTHDRIFSGRYVFQSFRVKNNIENSIVWAQCNDSWKNLRKICRTEIFTQKMIESQAHVRERKCLEMVEYLKGKQGEEVKIVEVIFGTLVNIFGNLIFSQNVFKLGDESSGSTEMKEHLWKMLELGNSTNPADYFPILGRFDLFGHRKEVLDCLQGIYNVWGAMLNERKSAMKLAGYERKNDFVDICLDAGLNDDQINSLFMVSSHDLFGAGTETSASTTEWAITELTRNPQVTAKIRSELQTVVGERPVKESDFPNLPYLQATVKETLRLHPPTPFLLPRLALDTCQVLNYTIPKNCQVMVNAWAIGRDPKNWTDPLTFSPERFLESKVDFKGTDFELIPFGGGRRICPGIPLANQFISLLIATMVHNFEWVLPNGMDPSRLIMEEKFGLTLQKEPPLSIVPKSIA